MKQQYIKLFSFLLGLTFIFSGVIYTFVSSYKDEKEEKKKEEVIIADEIGNVYKTFYQKEDDLSSFRKDLIKEFNEYVSFYSEMEEGYDDMVDNFKKYEVYVQEIEDTSSYLKDKCKSKYSSSDANEKCNYYYIYLEKSINMFVEDIKFFNNKIDEYNKWIEAENESVIKEDAHEKLKKYDSKKYKDYVDLNNDGTYLGMNSD